MGVLALQTCYEAGLRSPRDRRAIREMTACNHEQQTPEVWWSDLALRLRKAVFVMSDKPEVRAVFEAAEEDAREIGKLMAAVDR